MGRIEDLSLVADKGLEWKSKCEAITAERDHLRAKLEALADTYAASADVSGKRIAELEAIAAAAQKSRGELESLITDAHFKAFGSRQYAYVDCRSACDLLVAEIAATQHERDSAIAKLSAAETQSRIDRQLAETLEARALADAVRIAEFEAALAEERRCRQDSDSKLMGYDDRLNAAAYELAQERERLDWIATTNSMTSEEVSELINGYTYKGKYRGNVRAAIDAARGGGK